MRRVVLFLCLVSSLTAGAGELPLREWLAKYSSSDPFLTWNKTTPWPLDPKALTDIARDHFKANYQFAGPELNFVFKNFQQNVGPLQERDVFIRNRLVDFISEKAPADTLKFIVVGLGHGIDLFLARPDLTPAYAAAPLTERSEMFSAEYREVGRLLNRPPMVEFVGQQSASFQILPYAKVMQTLDSLGGTQLPERSLSASKALDNVIVIGDLHGIGEREAIEQLPSSEMIKAKGISSIEVAAEGYPSSETLTPEDYLRRYTFVENLELLAKKTDQTWQEALDYFPEHLRKKILAGQVESDPKLAAFARKLIDYKKAGIQVKMRGVEPDNVSICNHIMSRKRK